MPRVGGKTHLVFAADINYPPYAYLATPPEGYFEITGFGHDFAVGMADVCDYGGKKYSVSVVQTDWANCWDSGKIGQGLMNGWHHGCMTYTHTAGQRNRFIEFSHAILKVNKPAGLLVRLQGGKPTISPMDTDLGGKKVADVKGWAPTDDGLAFVQNKCYKEKKQFTNYEMITPKDKYISKTSNTGSPVGTEFTNENDIPLAMLLDGEVDAVWIYSDQAYYYDCTKNPDADHQHTCSMWAKFKTDFAYIQTGLYGHAINGTTLMMTRKGAGVADIVNPCIHQYMQTKEYYDICKKYKLEEVCYRNEYFPEENKVLKPFEMDTKDLSTACSDGYCPCDAEAA